MLKTKPRAIAGSPLRPSISKHRLAPRQLRLGPLAAVLLALLVGCSGRSDEQPGVVGTVRGFLGGVRTEVTDTEGRGYVRARTLSTVAQQVADPRGSAPATMGRIAG